MDNGDRKKLRGMMEELAKVEGNIFVLREFSPKNPMRTGQDQERPEAKPPKNERTPWIIVTVVLLLVFAPAALFTGYIAYQKDRIYKEKLKEWNDDQTVRNNLVSMVTTAENCREELLGKLREFCANNPALDGDYWWKDTRLNPSLGDAVLELVRHEGATVSDREWQFGLLHQFWVVEDGAYLYLQDMKNYGVNIWAEDALEMTKPTRSKVLYKNDDLLNAKTKGFQLMHLYAYRVEQIQEIVKGTIRTAVDKEAERLDYQRKLDIRESIINGIGTNNYMTDAEMQAAGKMSMVEYVDRSLVRGMYEADFEAKLAEKADYEEQTRYSKMFRGLSRISFYNCADVLISLNSRTNGQCAAILVPRTKQKASCFLVRSVQKDNPFVGRLETYNNIPEYEEYDTEKPPSIQMAVEKLLLSPEMIKLLHLKNRDVLAEKPENMDACEYAYLIWNDNPRGRVS